MKPHASGFTLVELVMVLVLLGVLSTIGSSLFARPDSFSALSARDQLQAMMLLAQQRALANISASPVVLTLEQTGDEWRFHLSQGSVVFQERQAPRHNAALSFNGSAFSNGQTSFTFASDASAGSNYQFVFSSGTTHPLCLAASGFAYPATCQP
ncbi:MAG: prepilin-type N-terminal cleavage/methylation domain-containing protein [Saccharospirillaceae bacterium]|nr:prepilin-type N-terminal cleavage/methylation domain-containing protein [Saccharospirillaceae bacterium]MCD8530572.1 prepilin-type N-terminal cleavage/methylation domain-containing protein [Saccharospirillaceae bacterium]